MFSDPDSPANSAASSTARSKKRLDLARPELTQLANAGENKIESKLGLNNSGRIVLDIIKIAQRAKSHRKDCSYIADQAYHLVNAVDGGVKGRAIDVNNILQDHVARLNRDLAEIHKIIKRFASWWILFRNWSAPRGLQKCYDILNHGMDMYLLLLRCSLNQPAVQFPDHQRYPSVGHKSSVRRTAHPAKEGRTIGSYPLPKPRPHPTASATLI